MRVSYLFVGFSALLFLQAASAQSSQFSGPHTVTDRLHETHFVDAQDLDFDGDLDVLSSALTLMGTGNNTWTSSQIAWYENQGGGVFSVWGTLRSSFLI